MESHAYWFVYCCFTSRKCSQFMLRMRHLSVSRNLCLHVYAAGSRPVVISIIKRSDIRKWGANNERRRRRWQKMWSTLSHANWDTQTEPKRSVLSISWRRRSRSQLLQINKISLVPLSLRTVTFYSHTLYLICLSFVISVIVINISRNQKHFAMPRWIRANILEGCIGKLFGGGAPTPPAADDDEDEEAELRQHQMRHQSHDEQKITQSSLSLTASNELVDTVQAQYIRLAKVIDRAAFVVFSLFYITMGALKYISIWVDDGCHWCPQLEIEL